MDTRALLASVQLENLADAFEAAGIDPTSIDSLSDDTLIALGATRIGDRARLRGCLTRVGSGPTVVPGSYVEPRDRGTHSPGAPSGVPRGVVLKLGDREIVWWLRDRVRLGRTTSEGADLLLAVEPFFPREQFLENYNKSYRVSRVHLSIERRNDYVYATPLGQAGVVVNGVTAMLNTAFHAQDGMVLVVADVLTLVIRSLDEPGAIHLMRRDNRPDLSYVIGARRLGLFPWDGEVELFAGEGADQAPIYLSTVGDRLLASSTGTWRADGRQIDAGVPVDVREGWVGRADDGSWAFTLESFIW